jgi:hypothetical protein
VKKTIIKLREVTNRQLLPYCRSCLALPCLAVLPRAGQSRRPHIFFVVAKQPHWNSLATAAVLFQLPFLHRNEHSASNTNNAF